MKPAPIVSLLEETRKKLQQTSLPEDEKRNIIQLLAVLFDMLGNGSIQNKEELLSRLSDGLVSQSALLAMLHQLTAELDALKRITLNLTSNLNMQAVLDAVVVEAMGLIRHAQEADIFLYRDGQIIFGASLDNTGAQNLLAAPPRPNGLTNSVARTGKMLVVRDIRAHPLFENTDPRWQGSIIGMPLIVTGHVIGVMNTVRLTTGGFTDSEIRLLQLLADQAAIAIMNATLHETAVEQAHVDTLTGLPNRRALDERLEEEVRRSHRTDRPFSVVMMDLDGFKKINDTFGHAFGDDVLRSISRFMADSVRASDFLARYGGDELTMILPESDLVAAIAVAEKLRARLTTYIIGLPDGTMSSMQISGGVAVYPTHGTSASILMRAADEALYRAKKHARGKFVVARGGTGELEVRTYQEF